MPDRIKSLDLLTLAFVALFLYGCSGLSSRVVLEAIREAPSEGYHIENVPFFPQDRQMCGPASLASVMGFWGRGAGMEAVAKEVYNEDLKGTLPIDLFLHAKSKGFNAEYYRGGLEDLKEKVRGGVPLIVFLNLGYDFYPVGHYMVVTGYSDRLKVVVAHSGTEKEKVYTYKELERDWSKTGFSTLLVRPKGD